MRFTICILCAACYFPVVAQTPTKWPQIRIQQALHNPEAILMAVSTTHEGDVFHLKGAVEIRTDTILLKADEASYNHETGEIDAHGDVKITPVSPLMPHELSQFGIK
jgi:lipopolysaccharide assembly outer membrane protein LptD (OstA)